MFNNWWCFSVHLRAFCLRLLAKQQQQQQNYKPYCMGQLLFKISILFHIDVLNG